MMTYYPIKCNLCFLPCRKSIQCYNASLRRSICVPLPRVERLVKNCEIDCLKKIDRLSRTKMGFCYLDCDKRGRNLEYRLLKDMGLW